MKKRRTVIIAALLVAALALGIGYAATTGQLKIEGVVSTQQQVFKVQFTSAEVTSASAGATMLDISSNLPDKVVSFTVNGLNTKDDHLTARFTIKNNNEFTMYITDITVSNDTSNVFDVTTSWDDMTDAVELAAGAETTVDVTVTLKQGMSEQVKQYFTITMNSTSVDPTP